MKKLLLALRIFLLSLRAEKLMKNMKQKGMGSTVLQEVNSAEITGC